MRKMTLFLAVLVITAPLAILVPGHAWASEYRIDTGSSWIRILAWPDGPLKRFGHHHVISQHDISGTVDVAENPLESTIRFEFSVADLGVDDPEMRGLDGEDFAGEVPQKDIDGTRANMLGEKLLHGEQFPTIRIESRAINGSLSEASIVASVFIVGTEQTVTFPASIELTDDSFVARGQLELTHEELGLSQFTAMGGALSVRDLLVLKYEISGTAANE